MNRLQFSKLVLLLLVTSTDSIGHTQSNTPRVGPATEARFPKLVTREGFRATLFACDPLVEYPSVISLGPRPGTLFVAHDYVTGLGVAIVRRDEVRLLSDSDNDGYADESKTFAKDFNSIQGLAYDGRFVYVMHAPLLTRLLDANGDGRADERVDLVNGLGLPPEKNSNRLHCANGVVVGHDGWLYLALGDRGCDVKRQEGDRLVFQEGGILRCRNDGTDLHVFCRGLRNIYDIALDDQLNVFVRDNENDGGDYMIRVCRCFFGSHHGYPYLYNERPHEALQPLADLGRGSSAGGTTYLETSFPPELRQSLFFCEWGRAVVTYPLRQKGSVYTVDAEQDFAKGADRDPYGFKPTDVIVDWDGSLVISDWGDGQRPKRGRGRIYRVQHGEKKGTVGKPTLKHALPTSQLVALLESPSYYSRITAQNELMKRSKRQEDPAYALACKRLADKRLDWRAKSHLVWIVAQSRQSASLPLLLQVADSKQDARLRVQAIRAIGDLIDPMLSPHRQLNLLAREKFVGQLLSLNLADPHVKLSAFIAIGRLRLKESAAWLHGHSQGLDEPTAHAAKQLLTNSGNWSAVLSWLDRPSHMVQKGQTSHQLALMATLGQFDEKLIEDLMRRLFAPNTPSATRRLIVDALALVQRRPKPWEYWGFRPQPRPANTVSWKLTPRVTAALRRCLEDPDSTIREIATRRMSRENIDFDLAPIAKWLTTERDPRYVKTILSVLQRRPFTSTSSLLESIVTAGDQATNRRLEALQLCQQGAKEDAGDVMLNLAKQLEDSDVLARAIELLPNDHPANAFLLAKVTSSSAAVRAAAIAALRFRRTKLDPKLLRKSLADSDRRVQRAAAKFAGVLRMRQAIPDLLRLSGEKDVPLAATALAALAELKAPGAVPQALRSLANRDSQIAALQYLRHFGDVQHLKQVMDAASANLDMNIQRSAIRTMTEWQARLNGNLAAGRTIESAIAKLQAVGGTPQRWEIRDSVERPATFVYSTGLDGEVRWPDTKPTHDKWTATAKLYLEAADNVEFLMGGTGAISVLVNDKLLIEQKQSAGFRLDALQSSTRLRAGMNVVTVKAIDKAKQPRFQLRFRRRSSTVEHEQIIRDILARNGNADRGRELFANVEKSQCMKCHQLADKGAKIGPDLSGLGSRFSKIYILESILQPSRTIAPSYATVSLRLANGKVISGVKIAETEQEMTIGDQQGKSHAILKSEIEDRARSPKSIMPDGLEKRLSRREIADLIAFLISEKR